MPAISMPPDVTLVVVDHLRAVLPGDVVVAPDLIGWTVGDKWVRVSRIGGSGMLQGFRHDDALLDVEIRAGTREDLAALRTAVRLAVLELGYTPSVAGATIVRADEETVYDLPQDDAEGFRSVLTYRLVVRAA